MLNWKAAAEKMVNDQLVARGIKDTAVLDAFGHIPRHEFVPETYKELAYADHPLPIGEGQTISQPYMVALMTELLKVSKKDRVLEVGTGSGYQAAILSAVAKEVYGVERFPVLAKRAGEIFAKLGLFNIKIKTGDGISGWVEHSPFDRIIITAATPCVPKELFDQLKRGGRLIVPIGGEFSQVLTLYRKGKEDILKEEFGGCVFVPLISGPPPRKECL